MAQRNKQLEEVVSGDHYGAETKKVQSRLNSPEMKNTVGGDSIKYHIFPLKRR